MIVTVPEKWWMEDHTERDLERMRQAGREAGRRAAEATLRAQVRAILQAAGLPSDDAAVEGRIAQARADVENGK